MQDKLRNGTALDREWLYSLYTRTMRQHIENTWGWNQEVQSRGFDEQLGAENFKVVTVDGDDIAGYCLKFTEDCLWLDMLLIEPSYQGRGIGKDLMDHINSLAKAKDLPVRLCSITANPATNFYKHLGYSEYKSDATLSYLEWEF